MHQLSGIDAAFLHMEDSRVTGHVGGVIVLDPSTADGPVNLATMKEFIGARLVALPPMRWKLVEVPLGIDRPYWIDDHEVDLDYHVRGIALPSPGTLQQLTDLVSRIHARPLDRNHPLWEIYVIEGLEGGRVAIQNKFHHAAIDGKAGMLILSTMLSPDPHAAPPVAPADLPPSESRPSDAEMLTRGWVGLLGQHGRALDLMVKAAGEWRTLGKEAWKDPVATVPKLLPMVAPRVSFNQSVTARRNWAFGSMPLSAVKKIKKSQGGTINDTVMALCAGALRSYLLARDELPEVPLRALVPVSTRTAEQSDSAGNQVSALIVELPTHEEGAVARMRAVQAAMVEAKKEFAALPASLLQDFSQFASPAAAELVARTAASMRLADKLALPFNLVISNVPGPRAPLYYAGALMEANYPLSMISDGIGLNITVHSYRDNLDFGLTSCPELIEDLPALIDHLHEELATLSAL